MGERSATSPVWMRFEPEIEMAFDDEKGRDDLIFDPLPPSRWFQVTDSYLRFNVPYSEKLSGLMRSLPGASWVPSERCWHVPFRASIHVRRALPEINELADAADVRAAEQKEKKGNDWVDSRSSDHLPRNSAAPSRPLRREYLMPTGLPCHVITVEAIGDDLARAGRAFGFKSRNWAAQIFGSDGRGGWVRSFLTGTRDYSRANSKGSRGIMVSYLLEQGPIYEIRAPLTWSSSDRYFARVMDNVLTRMTDVEVTECLEK